MPLIDEYIDLEQGIELEKYNKQKVIVNCHVLYCHVKGCLGHYTKESVLCNLKIISNKCTYTFPSKEYKFYDVNCFDRFVGCDIEFVATANIEEDKDGYYISLIRPTKISKVSSNENKVEVTYFTRYQESFIYDSINKELPKHFYKLIQEMDVYKVGRGKYFSMTLENAYEQNYGNIKYR